MYLATHVKSDLSLLGFRGRFSLLKAHPAVLGEPRVLASLGSTCVRGPAGWMTRSLRRCSG